MNIVSQKAHWLQVFKGLLAQNRYLYKRSHRHYLGKKSATLNYIEVVLIRDRYAKVARAYILYRKQHEKAHNAYNTLLDYRRVVDNYVKNIDRRVPLNNWNDEKQQESKDRKEYVPLILFRT